MSLFPRRRRGFTFWSQDLLRFRSLRGHRKFDEFACLGPVPDWVDMICSEPGVQVMVIGWVKSQRMLLQAGVQAVDMFVVRLSPCRLRREKRARQELELARDEHGFVNKSRDLETKGKGKGTK